MRALVFILATLIAGPAFAGGQVVDAGVEAVRARLAVEPGYAGVFGVAGEDGLTVGSLGEARSGRPHDPTAAVRWASVSKMITAILVFQQVEAGRLALDAPVEAYLPDRALPNSGLITIRDLLAHKSGLAQQSDFGPGAPLAPGAYCTAVDAAPGAFAYNNCDTIILGEILEAVTETPFVALANAGVAAPVGAVLTLPRDARVEARMLDGADEAEVWPSGYGAAGGLYGTVEDLLKIDVALMQGRLISADYLATMLKGDPASGFAALSVWSYEPDLGACLGKTRLVERYGEIGGVQVRNFLLPDRKLALAVYSNDRKTEFGEVWRGQGLSIDLIRAAACGAASG